MAFTRTWNSSLEATPPDSQAAAQGAARIREFRVDTRERFQGSDSANEVEHEVGGSPSAADSGFHNVVTLTEKSAAPATPPSGYGRLSWRKASSVYHASIVDDAGTEHEIPLEDEDFAFTSTTASTSSTTGAMTLAGGLGVADDIYVGDNITAGGTLYTTNTTQSTSATTGSVVGSGGLGIAKDAYIGGALNVAGVATLAAGSTVDGGAILSASGYAGLSAGAVGTYVFAGDTAGSGNKAIGDTIAGSVLIPTCALGATDTFQQSGSLSGTWRCMGFSLSSTSNTGTLWLRIS